MSSIIYFISLGVGFLTMSIIVFVTGWHFGNKVVTFIEEKYGNKKLSEALALAFFVSLICTFLYFLGYGVYLAHFQ